MKETAAQQSKPEWLSDILKDANSDQGRKVQLTARLTRSQYNRVQKLQENHGISQAEAIRRLLDKGMEEGAI